MVGQAYKPIVPYREGSETDSDAGEKDDLLNDRKALLRDQCIRYIGKGAIFLTFLLGWSLLVVSLTFKVAGTDRRVGQRFMKTPVPKEYIVYEPHVMERWEDEGPNARAGPYFVEPSPEVDENWHKLFRSQNIGIKAELMREMGREGEGILLPDGTYYASIMVFHHLHCIRLTLPLLQKNIYHALNPEYYGLDNMTPAKKEKWADHTSHCLHMLKEAILCQADTTPITMLWHDDFYRPIANMTSPHECVNWDRLMEWVEPHAVDLAQEGYLVHPKTGPVVEDGHLAAHSAE
ncbi:hypothetical protein VTL71DRAFT_6166 [Oculimacula yallundae]|uniref:Tat pathway signal sequence n=1 Tax=Oculimacula yallundae TaxID=86028 RepID=A0ABR4C178_9HELO